MVTDKEDISHQLHPGTTKAIGFPIRAVIVMWFLAQHLFLLQPSLVVARVMFLGSREEPT